MPRAEEEPTNILAVIGRSFYLESILLEKFPHIVLEVKKNPRIPQNLLGIVPEKYGECDYAL